MRIVYSPHARQQMKRRRISPHEVEETIRAPEVRSPGVPSDRVVLRRHVADRYMKVVVVEEQNIVVITTAVAGEEG